MNRPVPQLLILNNAISNETKTYLKYYLYINEIREVIINSLTQFTNFPSVTKLFE